jgi:hypothetical protein
MKIPEMLQFSGTVDGSLRLLFVVAAAVVLVLYSMVFELEYHTKLVDLYMYPLWRFAVVLLILFSSLWCGRVSILVALVVFFYLADMHTLLTPLASTTKGLSV